MSKDMLADQMLQFFPLAHRKLLMRTKKGELRHNEFILLSAVANKDGLPMRAYGERLCISKPNMTKVVDILEKEALLSRETDRNDRRIINLHITSKGKDFMVEHYKYMKDELIESLGDIPDQEISILAENFKSINNILSKVVNKNESKNTNSKA